MASDNGNTGVATMRGSDGVEVVLFDYGQVLSLPPDPAAWARMQSITAVSGSELHEAYWRFRHDYDRGTLDGRAYWRAVARRRDVVLNEEQISQLLAADIDLWAQPNQTMIAWARQLQRAGVRTAVLSNIGDAMADGLTARLGWLKGFERCVWSYALRMAKPEPEIFSATAKILGVARGGVLFIDDKEENIAAARVAGMEAIQYSTQAEFESVMRERGFASLLEIGAAARDSAQDR